PCSVTVSSTHKLSVHPLEAGTQRLSGRYRPKFDSIADELSGFQFTRTPWQASPTHEVTAIEDGFLYVFSISKPPTVDEGISKVLVEKMIRGPYLNKAGMYRINLKRGQSLKCKGGECGVIAKEITLK
ncbi:MAG: hypothetical protein ACR2RV_18780, partial [Verrucomicrobiales bacterium]